MEAEEIVVGGGGGGGGERGLTTDEWVPGHKASCPETGEWRS